MIVYREQQHDEFRVVFPYLQFTTQKQDSSTTGFFQHERGIRSENSEQCQQHALS